MTPIHTLLAVIVTLIWGINFTFIAWGLESFPPIMLTAMRFLFTAVPLVFFIKRPRFTRSFLSYAFCIFVIQYALLFVAMHLGASAGLTALLIQLQVFITVLAAYLILGEPVTRIQLIGMTVGMLGLAVIGANLGGDMPLLAFLCILLAATGWGFGNIASKLASKQMVGHYRSATQSALSLVSWGSLLSFAFLAVVSVVLEPSAWQVATFTEASMKSWLSLGFIVYVSTIIAFALWAYLLSENDTSKIVPFALLIPVFGMVTSVILTGEALTWWKMLAMVLILSGLVLANVKMRRFVPKMKMR